MEKEMLRPGDKDELIQFIEDPEVALGDIDTSLITDMSGVFSAAERTDFSGIGSWNTSAVTNMTAVRRMSIICTLRNRRTVSTSEVHRWTKSPVDTCL